MENIDLSYEQLLKRYNFVCDKNKELEEKIKILEETKANPKGS